MLAKMQYGKPSAHTPEAAAAQAEFNEKKRVWVPDEKEGYLAGYVAEEDGEVGLVAFESGVQVRCVRRRAESMNKLTRFLAI